MTAVEEFWKAVQDVLPPSSVGYETATKLGIAYEQAKEMERQQIMTAFTQGDIFGSDYFDGVNITEENYYNQTFKSE